MRIAICSDTHGRVQALRQALHVFDQAGAERIIHCGDVGDEAVFDELVGRHLRFVWGNTDAATGGLRAYLHSLGIPPPEAVPLMLEWAGRRIAVFHGHEPEFALADRLDVDYVLHGHTHVPRDDRVGGVRFINPGALHRARPRTVATLDLVTDHLTFHEIPETRAALRGLPK